MSKKRFLCKQLPKPHQPVKLEAFEAHHATRVLRLSNGALVEALDGQGHATLALLKVRGEDVWLEHTESTLVEDSQEKKVRLVLELAMLKGDAMEWAVEKAVELNVDELIPIETDFTVVQIKQKGAETFQGRWQKIADQALKQCGRLKRMNVALPVSIERLPEVGKGGIRLWCDDSAKGELPHLVKVLTAELHEKKPAEIRLFVGPEGGFSDKERAFLGQGAQTQTQAVSLGSLVLRAETAAIHGVSLILGCLEQE